VAHCALKPISAAQGFALNPEQASLGPTAHSHQLAFVGGRFAIGGDMVRIRMWRERGKRYLRWGNLHSLDAVMYGEQFYQY